MQTSKLLPIVIVSLAMAGCVFAPGDSTDWDPGSFHGEPTIGQQLIDLDRARDEGVISDAEFERTKQDILDSAR